MRNLSELLGFVTALGLACAAAASDTCATATPIGLGLTQFDTTTAADDAATNCDTFSVGPDRFYHFTPATTGFYAFETCGGASFDTVLVVRDGCGGNVLGCNNDFCGTLSRVVVGLTIGVSCIVQVDGNGAAGTGTLNVFGPVPTPNDTCFSAAQIGLGSTSFTTATAVDDAPAPCGTVASRDVFFRFTPTMSGLHHFDTCSGTAFDTVLAVYQFCGGVPLACNNDFCGTQSRVSVNLNSGVPYVIQVDGNNGASGAFVLNVTGPMAPPNDTCASAIPVGMGSTPFDTTFAGNQAGTACSGGGIASPDVFFTFTPASTAAYQFSTCTGTNFNTVLSILDGCGGVTLACNNDACGLLSSLQLNLTAGTPYIVQVDGMGAEGGSGMLTISGPPANETCAGATPIGLGATVYTTAFAADNAGTPCSSGVGRDIFYSFTPPSTGRYWFYTCGNASAYDTVLAVLSGCGGSVLACNNNSCGSLSSLSVQLTAGVPYIVQVDGNNGSAGTGVLTITGTLPGDTCDTAYQVGMDVTNFDTTLAANDAAVPCGVGSAPDVFFRFMPSISGPYWFSTCGGTNFDSVISVLSACGGSVLGCSNDSCGPQSTMRVNLTSGVPCVVQIDGNTGASGTGVLNITWFAPGDTCDIAIPVGTGDTAFDTTGASNDAPAPCSAGNSPDMFFRFTPTITGTHLFQTCSSSFDTVLAVLDGCGGNIVACNDDSPFCGVRSLVTTDLTAGTQYIVHIDGWGGDAGAGVLGITAPPANDTCANATPIGLGATNFSTLLATNDANTPCSTGAPDIFYRFTPVVSGLHTFSTCGGTSFNTALAILDGCGSVLTCNDDSCGTQSSIQANLTAGVPCIVQLDVAGSGTLSVVGPSPPGDTCASAIPIGLGATPFNTTPAANDSNPTCAPGSGPDIFFAFTPASTGIYQFDTCSGTTYDSALAIRDGCGVSGTICDNDSCGLQSRFTVSLTAGSTYIIQVDGVGSAAGAGTLTVAFLGASEYTVCPSANTFEDISSTGTLAGTISACNNCSEPIPLGFSFEFFGTAYTSASVSSNGLVSFASASVEHLNQPIPFTSAPNQYAAAIWDDLDPGAQGSVYFRTAGSPGSRTCTISWQGVTQFAQATNENFQVVLHEGSNIVEFRYGAMTAQLTAGDYTIGVENATGSSGASINGADIGAGNTARFFVPLGGSCPSACDSIDFNGDGLFPDTQDIADFIAVFGGAPCPTGTCGDIDFNNDGLFPDTSDISALISVFGGGPCE
ncbi:MAG TPA: hypothetical protein VHN77_10000 [Phycisphaerales bacterium]|nr:hypothetical protein [Phycisphaerales bacterium]